MQDLDGDVWSMADYYEGQTAKLITNSAAAQ